MRKSCMSLQMSINADREAARRQTMPHSAGTLILQISALRRYLHFVIKHLQHNHLLVRESNIKVQPVSPSLRVLRLAISKGPVFLLYLDQVDHNVFTAKSEALK
jgi:adenine C2-methylase RlmN of 23S rRNA A2503 and tRNA A37